MTVSVTSVHIVIVIFPVLCASIVGRIDIDAVNFASIELLQKLQGMVVVRLDKCMPKITVRCIADSVNRL